MSLPYLLKSSPKKFWSVFKNTRKQASVPNKVTWTRDETVETADNPSDISGLLNRYFYSAFKNPLSCESYLRYSSNSPARSAANICELSNLSLTPNEVRDILLNLDVNKSTGPDKIPAKLLRGCAPYICTSLCSLFNKCLSLGKVPSSCKLSNIVPIHKDGSTKEVPNYRPISLSLVSKVMERCIYNKIINHISTQLYKLQLQGQRLYKRNLSLYLYMFIAVTLTSSVPTACSRLTL